MARTLAEYYAIDYPKCKIDDSFIASWQFLAYSCRISQFIAVPIQIWTGYFILKKTPVVMKSVKFPLLTFHVFCSLQDFIMNSLSNPYLFLPSYAYLGVGFLSFIGIPLLPQVMIMFFSIYCTGAAMTYLFESRSSLIQNNPFKLERWTTRLIYYSGNVLLEVVVSLWLVWKIPIDQDAAKLEVLSYMPCPTRLFFTEPTYVALDSYWADVAIYIIVPILLAISISQVFFFVSCSIVLLYCSKTDTTSSTTRRLQRNFFIGILFQTMIPIVLMGLPYAVLTIAINQKHLTQGMTNIYFIVFGLHGLMESFAIILVHESYRKAVLGFFGCGKPAKRSSISILPMGNKST
ncbi:unnamed protein product [Caenorhabditis brenneri]